MDGLGSGCHLFDNGVVGNSDGSNLVTHVKLILAGLAEVVRLRRIELDLSQKQLAEKVGCGRNYIIALETSRNEGIPIVKLIHLADALNYSVSEMFRLSEVAGERLTQND